MLHRVIPTNNKIKLKGQDKIRNQKTRNHPKIAQVYFYYTNWLFFKT